MDVFHLIILFTLLVLSALHFVKLSTFHPRLSVSYILRPVGKSTNDRKTMRILCDFQSLMYMSDLYRPPVAYHTLLYLHNLRITPKNLPKLKYTLKMYYAYVTHHVTMCGHVYSVTFARLKFYG